MQALLEQLPWTLPHFRHPLWLLGLLLLPLIAWWRHRRRPYGALTYSSLPRAAVGSWLGQVSLQLPFYLRLAALALLLIALSRPQQGLAWEENLTEGIDIVVALDTSGSMAAQDFQPQNRLAVAKEVVKEFVDKRAADRIGLVVFAGRSMTRAPLTSDRRMLQLLVDSVELDTLGNGTAIGMALGSSANRLKDSAADSKVVVLVTDGVNNAGNLDPDSAAEICKGLGIKVYTIGVGTRGMVPVPMQDRDRRTGRIVTRNRLMEVEIDEELLKKIAEETGGRYFEAQDPESLREIFAEIDDLEKTTLEIKRYIRYREVFQPLIWLALGLLVLPLPLALTGMTIEP